MGFTLREECISELFTLREHRSNVFMNRVLMRIFGLKREDYFCFCLQTLHVGSNPEGGMTHCTADPEIYPEVYTVASFVGPAQTVWSAQDSQRRGMNEANAECEQFTHISSKAPHKTFDIIDSICPTPCQELH
jgi:hypothetical protein